MAATPRPPSDDEALKLMIEHGIITKGMTWEKIDEASKKIGTPKGDNQAGRWSFWVKGKFINRDDEK
jgi:hypothetical protein